MSCGALAGRDAGEDEEVGLGLDHRQQHRREVGGVHLVGHVRGNHFEPERLGRLDAAVALAERVGLVGRHEGDLLDALVFLEVLVDRRAGLVVRDHAEHGVRGRGGVERLREGVGEVDDPVLLGHRADRGRAVIDVGADDVVDALLRHLLHAGDGALGVLLVVEGDDLDVVGLVADLDPAGLVQPGGERLHGAHVRGAPGGRRAAGDADEADLELVGVLGQRRAAHADDGGGRGREGDGFQKVASLHRILSPDRCHSRL